MTSRCGFVAVIGAPNAGKSTLVNGWVGEKVSIVSPRVQTTRTQVRGIVCRKETQIIFIDTPGIFAPKKRLEKAMVAAAWQGEAEADAIILAVDAARRKIAPETAHIVEALAARPAAENAAPVILLLNKVDRADKGALLALAQDLNTRLPFSATFMVSALTGNGADAVPDYLSGLLPEGPFLFPADQVADMPLRLLAAEITREKLFHRLYQELPHALTVETEQWEDFKDGSVKISQCITVARETHKAIVLGKGGTQIKAAGEEARHELADIIGAPVHLKLFVRVQENWSEDPEKYSPWGLNFSA